MSKRNKNRSKAVQKTSSSSGVVKLPKKGVGSSGISFYQQILNRIQPYELKWPQSMRTFEAMKNDDAIGSVLNLYYALVEIAFTTYKIKYNKSSKKSEKAAEFLDYAFNSLEGQSFQHVIRNAATFKEKGFSVLEKVYSKIPYGEYKGLWKISNLANRPQLSLDESIPFEIDAGGRRIKSCRQSMQAFQNDSNNHLFIDTLDMTGEGYKRISRKKFMLFGDGATDSNPLGTPIFRSCYKLWREKLLLEDLEVNGASKDLAGIIELAIPGDILTKAHNDPTSPEASMVTELQAIAANIHNGEQSYFVRPSDLQENSSSVTDYGIRLLGLEGSGRQFSPREMITDRRKAIFDIWGAGHTLTGEGSVSYNSAEVQSSIHMYHVKRDINNIVDVINKDLIPQLLNDMNEFGLSYKDMPKMVAGDIDKISIEEISKAIQRVKGVSGLVLSKEIILQYHEWLGFDIDHLESLSDKELYELMQAVGKGTSRSGESGGTSGTGDSQDISGGDNNMDNTA